MKWNRFLGMSALSAILSALTCPFLHSAEKEDPIDRLLIKAQQICPVSGVNLGDHGEPVKTVIDGRTLFLCCAGCKDKPVVQEHVKKIAANQIASQKKCPVMGHELPENAASTVAKGRTLYVCCKPCTKKITSDPDKYVQKFDAMLAENIGSDK